MLTLRLGLLTALALATASVACGPMAKVTDTGVTLSTKNLVRAEDGTRRRTIGDTEQPYEVIDSASLAAALSGGSLLQADSPGAAALFDGLTRRQLAGGSDLEAGVASTPLAIGFPVGMLGEEHLFGGVVTKVSAHDNEDLGMLKLSDLPPIHVSAELAADEDGKRYLALFGCVEACSELAAQELIVTFPVLAVGPAGDTLFVDVSAFGKETSLVAILDPDTAQAFDWVDSETAAVDYSYATLVFDVATTMRPKIVDAAPQGDDVVFTARWYLRALTATSPFFTTRAPVKDVGYFTTQRNAQTQITRWSLTSATGTAPVKYFLKTIPDDVKDAFAAALTEWNQIFEDELGRKLLTWEFVDAGDPRADALVAGDIRYNVLEWDLVNAAPYGGLGPSIASQATGEILSANTLVQGPLIVNLYKEWFKLSEDVRELRAAGDSAAADRLFAEGSKALDRRLAARESRPELRLGFGAGLPARIPAQLPAFADPAMARQDFFETPPGETYETYMAGYWKDLVGHELGHNLGLRHNFRGNLGATGGSRDKVSRSVMEYLNRTTRHQDSVGSYDRMAISYGYRGAAPIHSDWYCTDEDAISGDEPSLSPECSRDDVSTDPFAWFESLFARVVRHVTAPDTAAAPIWTTAETAGQVAIATNGLLAYAGPASAQAYRWTNWGTRSTNPAEVRAYVLGRVKGQLCDPAIEATVARKETEEAKQLVRDNVALLKAFVAEVGAPYGVTAGDLACAAP